jgi:hypothetical protein
MDRVWKSERRAQELDVYSEAVFRSDDGAAATPKITSQITDKFTIRFIIPNVLWWKIGDEPHILYEYLDSITDQFASAQGISTLMSDEWLRNQFPRPDRDSIHLTGDRARDFFRTMREATELHVKDMLEWCFAHYALVTWWLRKMPCNLRSISINDYTYPEGYNKPISSQSVPVMQHFLNECVNKSIVVTLREHGESRKFETLNDITAGGKREGMADVVHTMQTIIGNLLGEDEKRKEA